MPLIPSPIIDVNGLFLSRSSVDIKIDNNPMGLFKGVHWSNKATRGKTWGQKSTPRGRGRAKADPGGDIELYLEDFDVLTTYLTGKNPTVGWQNVAFTITITAFEPGRGTFRVELIGCMIDEDDIAVSDGDDQLSKKLTLNIMKIVENNKQAVIDRDRA